MADSTKPHAFNPPTLATPPPTYKQVATTPMTGSSNLVTLAGQTGVDPTTGYAPAGLVLQVQNAYRNVENALKAAGATPRDIIFVRHYIVQDSQDAELNQLDIVERGWGELWMKFMDTHGDGHRPPDTVLGVAGLAKKGLLYEVECWAVVNQ